MTFDNQATALIILALVTVFLWAIAFVLGAVALVTMLVQAFKGVTNHPLEVACRRQAERFVMAGVLTWLPGMWILIHAVTGKWLPW